MLFNPESFNPEEYPVLFGLFLNVAALIWGASSISTNVKHLTETVSKLDENQTKHETRISRIEGAMQIEEG